MNIFRYLRYLPILIQLITFIQQAEALFREPGSGSAKREWVKNAFTSLVRAFQGIGLVSEKLADALIFGAGAIIDLIVQVMNATGGVPPADPDIVDSPPVDTIYEKPVRYTDESEIPSVDTAKAAGAQAGDEVQITRPGGGSKMWKYWKAGSERDRRWQTVSII